MCIANNTISIGVSTLTDSFMKNIIASDKTVTFTDRVWVNTRVWYTYTHVKSFSHNSYVPYVYWSPGHWNYLFGHKVYYTQGSKKIAYRTVPIYNTRTISTKHVTPGYWKTVTRTVRVFNPERTKQGLGGYALLLIGTVAAFTPALPIAPTIIQEGLTNVIDAFTKPVYA